ncbi:hypothetical protein IQ63_34495 [Streptomyces acidiscabies]|uniref:Uncharacterized protein n=1 Tax=Streptomyces acidiscabies TaxID=42234 RepID=A0A0L0JRA9_9ACTN|nr:hypothetical protein IQ63_34495 [Streptomyces acidiscabies]
MPAAVLPSRRWRAYRAMKVLRPTKVTDRKTTARDSFTKEAVSSWPGRNAVPGPAVRFWRA